VTLPATVATGSYYVIASADTNGQVVEASETNNAAPGVLVRIGPDLTLSALTAPFSTAAGSTITVNSTVSNQGGGAASASTTRFYLSANAALDGSDVFVGSASVGPLNGGQSAPASMPITIPAGTAPGYYFLIAVADGEAAVTETLESNNTRLVSVQVTAGM
jgi:subtilase family serine protease